MFKKQQGEQFVELKSKSGQLRKFTKVKYLGSGGFARCYEVYENLNDVKTHYAVKIIKKSTLYESKQLIERLRTEIKLHKKFSEPEELQNTHIVRFIDSFETQDYIYLLLELCVNQTLNQLIRRRKILSQEQTRFFIKQLAKGLKQLHSKNVVHRDIKLCNLFISSGLALKIGDFGLATEIKQNKKRFTLCGTANYIAPQMIRKNSNGSTFGHAYQVDVWALGVVCYTIYYGRYPFEAQDQQAIYSKIIACKYSFNPYTMREMKDLNINGLNHFPSQELKSFLKSIFELDPVKRLTLDEILQHPFLNKTSVPQQLPQIALKCQLKKETLDQLFIEKNNDQESKSKISKKDDNINDRKSCQTKSIQNQHQNQTDDCKSPLLKQKINERALNLVSTNSTTDQTTTKINKKCVNQEKIKNQNQIFYFKLDRKIAKSLKKQIDKKKQTQQLTLNTQGIIPSLGRSKKLFLEVFINKSRRVPEINKNRKIQKIGPKDMIIKVYTLKNNPQRDQQKKIINKKQNRKKQYSLVVSSQQSCIIKVFEQKVTQKTDRLPLEQVECLSQKRTFNENSSHHQQCQSQSQQQKNINGDLHHKKSVRIPLISSKTLNKQYENQIHRKFQEELYIFKKVLKYLQGVNSHEVKNFLNIEVQKIQDNQLQEVSDQQKKLTSLNDVVKNHLTDSSDPDTEKTQKSTLQSLKCQDCQLAY